MHKPPRQLAALWGGAPVVVGLVVGGLVLEVPPSIVVTGVLIAYLAAVLFSLRALGRLWDQAETNQHIALHDPVTELPNRTLFHDRVQQAIVTAKRNGGRVGVMSLDLDRFKDINDALGHHCGDLLLYRVGERLQGTIRGSDTIARLGGDEFAVLLSGVDGNAGALEAAQRVCDSLDSTFEIHEVGLEIEVSAGLALYPAHGEDADSLLQRADIAMYWAKDRHTQIELYDSEEDDDSLGRLEIINELRRALEGDELILHYQPKAEMSCSRIVGVEALIRWEHPTRGLIAPVEFIPLAETTGLIRPLTLFVLDQAIEQCAEWAAEGLDLTMAINLSTRNLLDDTMPDEIAAALARHGVEGSRLEIEVTETQMMMDPVCAAETLEQISRLGVTIAIDDFGTGYTSLSWLKQLPVTTLKIDQSFVMAMDTAEEDAAIVRSTVNLARDLGLEVVAEGVERQGVWDELSALGCDCAQGYILSRPRPAAELRPILEERIAIPSDAPEAVGFDLS